MRFLGAGLADPVLTQSVNGTPTYVVASSDRFD